MSANNFDIKRQDEYLKSNINNIISFAKTEQLPKFTAFLDERQQKIVTNEIKKVGYNNYYFYGGIQNATRLMLGVFPNCDSIADVNEAEFPITPIRLSFSNKFSISHRDVLGSIMGLGLKRESIGDIVFSDDFITVFVKSDISNYILSNLSKIGRVVIKTEISYDIPKVKQQEFQEITGTVASLRLDNVIAFILSKSRTIAVEKISSNLVKLNYEDIASASKLIKPNDIITIKGSGKYVLCDDIKYTKKDRLFIKINKYL